jgi:hydroxymethylpyrimidine/phosphomethylpyrimidine kinase
MSTKDDFQPIPAFGRPYVLSIAGFDPSGGAGILADVKTFEANHAYGLGVCTAITYQDESSFSGLSWISLEEIIRQTDTVLKKYKPDCIKIGLIESLPVLLKLIHHIRKHLPTVRIIWDPILKASAGFDFHSQIDLPVFRDICSELFLITPNIPEAVELGEAGAAEMNAAEISKACNVFLKGGHRADKTGEDLLFLTNGKRITYGGRPKSIYQKHGTGCILSSAIAARLAKGADLEKACLLAKDYTLTVLESNISLLGFHAFEGTEFNR